MVQASLKKSTLLLNQSMERMTTGYRINSAKDDAAGYAVASKMSIQLSSYNVAKDNTEIGLSYLSTATSTLGTITTQLQRIRDLTEEASNGTYGSDSRNAIQIEINQRTSEINRILSSTEYNGKNIFQQQASASSMVSNVSSFTSGEIYNISSVADMNQLATLVDGGADTTGVTFILDNDVDMSTVSNFARIGTGSTNAFKGTFDGNGYTISNLTVTSAGAAGLFGYTTGATIENIGVTGGNITSTGNWAGVLVGYTINTTIDNSYTTGNVNSTNNFVGGLVGVTTINSTISQSYSSANVTGVSRVGGLVGQVYNTDVSEAYSTGNVSGSVYAGTFIGYVNTANLSNSYSSNTSTSSFVAGAIGTNTFSNCVYATTSQGVATGSAYVPVTSMGDEPTMGLYGFSESSGWDFSSGGPPELKSINSFESVMPSSSISFKVGIDSSDNSSIYIDTGLSLSLSVDAMTADSANNSLDSIDNALKKVTKKQTDLGAVSNRLQSASDSIDVSINNLTSSLSTVRDTDVAKESASYIKQQILQQASATLLATANQLPSIALSLI